MRPALSSSTLAAVVLLTGLTGSQAASTSDRLPPPAPASAAQSPDARRAAPPPAPRARHDATVLRVEDGDTLVVRLRDGRRRHVRVLGIDTPEVLFGQRECGGPSASRRMKAMAPPGTRLRLLADGAQPRVDRYHRLLRYVLRSADGLDVGREQLRRGLARVYVYGDGPFRRRAFYLRVQREAQQRDAGIWGSC